MKQDYFKNFGKLELKEEAKLSIVEAPKTAIVLTYEQPLFYIARNPEDQQKYYELQSHQTAIKEKMNQLFIRFDTNVCRRKKIKDFKAQIASKKAECEKLQSGKERTEAYQELHTIEMEMYSKIRADVDQMMSKSSEYQHLASRYKSVSEEKNATLIVTPKSPVETLKVYGVLDFTVDRGYNTWHGFDNSGARQCIRDLTSKLIEDFQGADVKSIESIILFSGLYGYEAPFQCASEIASALELPKGIVQVFHTGYANQFLQFAGDSVTLQKKQREDLGDLMMKYMPKDVIMVDIPAGFAVKEIMDMIKK